MTDRLKGFVVTFEEDIREDDAEHIQKLVAGLKGVASVDPLVSDFSDVMARRRVRCEIRDAVMRLYRELGEK